MWYAQMHSEGDELDAYALECDDERGPFIVLDTASDTAWMIWDNEQYTIPTEAARLIVNH